MLLQSATCSDCNNRDVLRNTPTLPFVGLTPYFFRKGTMLLKQKQNWNWGKQMAVKQTTQCVHFGDTCRVIKAHLHQIVDDPIFSAVRMFERLHRQTEIKTRSTCKHPVICRRDDTFRPNDSNSRRPILINGGEGKKTKQEHQLVIQLSESATHQSPARMTFQAASGNKIRWNANLSSSDPNPDWKEMWTTLLCFRDIFPNLAVGRTCLMTHFVTFLWYNSQKKPTIPLVPALPAAVERQPFELCPFSNLWCLALVPSVQCTPLCGGEVPEWSKTVTHWF